ncbi:hypothetical protein ACFODT_13635 [Vibrio zhugei]|uniref:DUF3159 domain-containing protein n=1 Tax=Vibrio zhugei TaxID=2479546 RepID=A0ABV7C9V5_9VIBR|nr:hypothetical protein [Vibrio zhugei]
MFDIAYRLVRSKESILTILIPSILYLLVYHEVGLIYAIVGCAIYGIAVTLVHRQLGMISLAFALSGIIELMIIALLPPNAVVEAIQYKVALSAVSTAGVFFFFALARKPIPMLIAEISCPELQRKRLLTGSPSLNRWQQVNSVWLVGYLLKSVLFLTHTQLSQQQLVTYTLLSGWPLYAVLIFASVWIIRRCHPIQECG